ncbi:DUF116 domain-containing protein [Haliovirga abyssi]|uniref:Nucleotide-binding protein n=1 Tax=Haliovirga abyssi TaxID=2996794 RepID=A0AAU9DHG6_9FUSO|nr:DUF116 domain-containing protein [Haliovirga abyssi]BDU50977.1 nucleotide-binding protein [Haliovirga abyssi]
MKLIYYRIVSTLWIFLILIFRKIKDDDYNNSLLAKKFMKFNNKFAINRLKKKKIPTEKIAILLPHCLQDDNCLFKITSDISNCKKCGKCKIGEIVKLKEKYDIKVKVATGGTLARLFIKKTRPKFIIAVACERDLITGIYDSFPLNVYGIFNERINGPCYNTNVNVNEIEEVLKKVSRG